MTHFCSRAIARCAAASSMARGTGIAVFAAHLAEGNMQEAVRHYVAFSRLLDEELGVPPSALFARQLQSGAAGRRTRFPVVTSAAVRVRTAAPRSSVRRPRPGRQVGEEEIRTPSA